MVRSPPQPERGQVFIEKTQKQSEGIICLAAAYAGALFGRVELSVVVLMLRPLGFDALTLALVWVCSCGLPRHCSHPVCRPPCLITLPVN